MKKLLDFSNVLLYVVTPEIEDEARFFEKLDQILAGGTDAVQLRSKKRPDRDLLRIGEIVKEKCQDSGALFIVNNRPDLALALEADGVHLGHRDLPIHLARQMLGYKKIIGASAHSVAEALSAQREGADYVSCGPIWATPTKPEYEAVGLGLIDLYRASIGIPFVVIGGIDEFNIDQVVAHGAKRAAFVRALFESANPKMAAQDFRAKIEMNWKPAELGREEVVL